MSKSLGEKHYIGVFEDEESIRRKIKTHVTDSGGARGDGELPPGVENLLLLLEVTAPADVLTHFRQAEREGRLMYRDLKEAVSEHLLALLRPLRDRRESLSMDEVRAALHDGAERARRSAREVVDEVRERIGIAGV
jgi:tryptophanyl-tRNA synthetase